MIQTNTVPLAVKIQYDVNSIFVIPTKNIQVIQNHYRENDDGMNPTFTVFLMKKGLDSLSLDWKEIRKLGRKYKVFSIYHKNDGISIHLKKKDIFDWLGVG